MRKIGISLYPEYTTLEEDTAYLRLASELGFRRLFTSFLQFNPEKVEASMKRFKESIQAAKKSGFEIIVDVHPYVFKYLGINYDQLHFFYDLGLDGIRLDTGFTGREEAKMTRNPYNLKIEINMSNDNHYLDQIWDYNPKMENLIGCHNFYPQSYTGLSDEKFEKCSRRFKEKGLRTAAFVTSQNAVIGPWPVQEGLCTLESHRGLSIEAQVKDFMMGGLVDDIIIGNVYASERELRAAAEIFFSPQDTIKIELFPGVSELEREILFENIHHYRGDSSEYMIRSTRGRIKYMKMPLPKKEEVWDIRRGDILILNEEYGQYKAEVQIALKDRPGDERINIVGRVHPDQVILLNKIKPYQEFSFYE